MSIIGNYIYKDDKWIGKGTFGTVYKAYKNNHPETIYALKKIDLKELERDDKRHCYDEVKVMREIHHPNIVSYHDSFEYKNRFLVIIMEFCETGSLKNYIQMSATIPERECLEIGEQLCSALKFLHENGKIHRDVKTDNIFLTKDKTVKLGDLALVRVVKTIAYLKDIMEVYGKTFIGRGPKEYIRLIEKPGRLTTSCGSPLYMSPEMYEGNPYSYKTDVWSFGCCLYEIAMKKSPFSALSESELQRKIGNENLRTDAFPYGEEVKVWIEQMLQKNPDRRPNIFQVDDTLNSLLHKPIAEEQDSDSEAFDIPPQMRNMPISHGSATFPGPRTENIPSEACRPRKKKSYRQRPLGSRRPAHDPSSSDDRGYSSSDTRDMPLKGQETKVINIPVEVTPEELDMMKFASDLESTLKRYLSSDEWQKMSSILTELSKEEPAVEEKFMERLAKVLRQEILAKVKPFLSSYWSFKMPLLKRTYKMAQTGS